MVSRPHKKQFKPFDRDIMNYYYRSTLTSKIEIFGKYMVITNILSVARQKKKIAKKVCFLRHILGAAFLLNKKNPDVFAPV